MYQTGNRRAYFRTARATIMGIELAHLIRNGRVRLLLDAIVYGVQVPLRITPS